MENPLVSVIVPIHNTAKYIEQCIISILNQTLTKIEVICVDDCSTDNSFEIIERLAQKDPRIVVIKHEKNLGQGGARNTGIINSRAEFIASVDSDDTMKPQMLQRLWDESNNGQYDIVCCGYTRVDEYGNELESTLFQNKTIKSTDSFNIFTLMNPAIWNKLWRKSLFVDNDIYFPNQLYYQDMATIPLLVAKAGSIKFLQESLYYYLVRPGSVTNTFSPKHILDYFKVYGILYDSLERFGLMGKYSDMLYGYINEGMRFHSNNVVKSHMSEFEIHEYLRLLLMMKVSFIQTHEHLLRKDTDELIQLLKTADSYIQLCPDTTVELGILKGGELQKTNNKTPHFPDLTSSQPKDIFPESRLTFAQKLGSKTFGVVFRHFILPKQKLKLRDDPAAFFRDSKHHLTRRIGNLLKFK